MRLVLYILIFFNVTILSAASFDKMTINGYFSFEFEEKISGDENVAKADEHSSFDSDMIDIVLNIQATDRLRVAVDFTWEHGSQSEIDKGNVGYEYAFAEYTLSNAIKIRVGKMFTPFGIYNELHTAKPSTIVVKEPNPTNKMYYISYDTYEQTLLYPRWGTGVALVGNNEMFGMDYDYALQITNGDLMYGVDENEYDKDDNDQKALTARIRLNLTDDLQIGASAYHDKMTRYEKYYKTKVVTDSDGNTVDYVTKEYEPAGSITVDSKGLQSIWHINDDLRLEVEYMTGTLDVEGIKKFRRSGYSILPSYFITENINFYFLYAKADPNHSVKNNSVVNYAPGVNIEIDDNMHLKIDLFNVVSEDDNTIYNSKKYTEARAALAIGF